MTSRGQEAQLARTKVKAIIIKSIIEEKVMTVKTIKKWYYNIHVDY